METILVTMDKTAEDYVKQAKEILDSGKKVIVKGNGRDTVKAVDVAELLKIENYKAMKVEITTEEKELVEDNRAPKMIRTSTIKIEMEK